MRKMTMTLIMLWAVCFMAVAQDKPEKMWIQFDDRFTENEVIDLKGVDSIGFSKSRLYLYKYDEVRNVVRQTVKTFRQNGDYRFDEVQRAIVKPSGYRDVDFTKESSQWCFQRSMESEHFICFWENGLELKNNSVSYNGSTLNVKTLLSRGEEIWKNYVDEQGFLEVGNSPSTDTHKICMFIVKTSWDGSDWRADGSGQDGTITIPASGETKWTRVGLFHCTPRAANAEGGHTVAHEIGHVFQFLVSADLGANAGNYSSYGWQWGFGDHASGGCAWWESCAQWQAYQVYPATLFTSGYYNEYVNSAYKNLLHEDYRYANYFVQYYWTQLYGKDFIGKLWRATRYPEDPVETFKRMKSLSQDDFNKIMFDYACRTTTWDIDGLRERGKSSQNAFSTILKHVEGTDNTYQVSEEQCPQNYGFNIIRLKGFEGGKTVKVHFKGVAGTTGFRSVKTDKAGWRYGFVAQTEEGSTVYGEMQSDKEGDAELVLPENTKRAWLVVTGAPTEHWRHPWDDDASNDEQWPYQVTFESCSAQGAIRNYGDYPSDYERKDVTVRLDAELIAANDYSGVNVPYDMDEISQALGISTAQMKSVKCNTSGSPGQVIFAGVNADGSFNYNTTTTSSTEQLYGHWFTTKGDVGIYDGKAPIYAEMNTQDYICKVGQYPGKLVSGNTYIIRQAIIYVHTDGKRYKAIMEVHLKMK
ncbi:MAG: DUF4859 domain-containing protein [Bacteroidales bacterium]|nr:DUF4859 domain-containing protein [Bacteroidales bacterium]